MATHRAAASDAPVGTEWRAGREAVLAVAKAIHAEGLVIETAGNVSARVGEAGDLLAVTASGVPYPTMTLDDIVVVDHEGEPVHGDAIPSTEMLMHAAIYRARPDVGGVVHTHSTYASALAVAGIAIPPLIDEMVVALGDGVAVADYAFPSTEELGENVIAALGERKAVLMRNHGFVGVGRSVEEALAVARQGEHLAQVFALARSLGNAEPLPADIVEAEMELYRMRRDA